MYKSIHFQPEWSNVEEYIPGVGPAMKSFNTVDCRVWEEKKFSPNAYNLDMGQTWESTESQGNSGPFVMTVFTGGRKVERVEKREERETKEYVREKLNQTFQMEDKKVWRQEKLSLHHRLEHVNTGYSYGKVGRVCSVTEKLNSPMENPKMRDRLFFAGEHCSSDFAELAFPINPPEIEQKEEKE